MAYPVLDDIRIIPIDDQAFGRVVPLSIKLSGMNGAKATWSLQMSSSFITTNGTNDAEH